MDDDQLITVVREVLAVDETQSQRALAAANAALGWLCIDEMRADVIFDSADSPPPCGLRGRPPRQLTYRFGELLIDCELQLRTLRGQVTPTTLAGLGLRSLAGQRPITVDEHGRFTVTPVPSGPVSLHCLLPDRRTLLTPWLLA